MKKLYFIYVLCMSFKLSIAIPEASKNTTDALQAVGAAANTAGALYGLNKLAMKFTRSPRTAFFQALLSTAVITGLGYNAARIHLQKTSDSTPSPIEVMRLNHKVSTSAVTQILAQSALLAGIFPIPYRLASMTGLCAVLPYKTICTNAFKALMSYYCTCSAIFRTFPYWYTLLDDDTQNIITVLNKMNEKKQKELELKKELENLNKAEQILNNIKQDFNNLERSLKEVKESEVKKVDESEVKKVDESEDPSK